MSGSFGPASTSISEEVMRKLRELETKLDRGVALRLPKRYSALEKPTDGMLAYADGTEWDPGSGKGPYFYLEGNWIPLLSTGVVTPQMFGAVGDGVTDDTAALQAAVDSGSPVFVPPGTYKITDVVTVSESNVTIIGNGATIDASSLQVAASFDSEYAFLVTGTIGSTTTVSSDIAAGDRQITVSTTGYEAGNMILLKSSAEAWPVGSDTSSDAKKGMVHRVRSIDDSTHLTLMDGSLFDFTAATTTIQKITPIENVVFENLNVIMGGVDKAQVGVRFQYFENCWFKGGSIRDAEDANFRCSYGIGGGIVGADLSGATSPDEGTGLPSITSGYGVNVYNAVRGFKVTGNKCRNNRHSISGSGAFPNAFIDVVGNEVDGSRANPNGGNYDIECHEECLAWTFSRNKITGDLASSGSGGMMIRGQRCIVDANQIFNATQYGILIRGFGTNPNGLDGCIVTNNIIEGSRLSGIYSLGEVAYPNKNITIRGNQVRNATEGVHLAVTHGAVIEGNQLIDCGKSSTSALRLNGSATTDDHCSNVAIGTNIIDGADQYGVRTQYAENVALSPQIIVNTTLQPINLENSTVVSTAGIPPSEVATGTYACRAIIPVTEIDSSAGAVTATLSSGSFVGQQKMVVMTNATASSTLSVTNHVTSDPEVFTFDAVDEALLLQWTGTEWMTVHAQDVTT